MGWSIPIPEVSRKTSSAIPQYTDADIFVLSGVDDLVPVPSEKVEGTGTSSAMVGESTVDRDWIIQKYRPRVDSNQLRIERWTKRQNRNDVHWRTISDANLTTIFGDSESSRVADISVGEQSQQRHFSWLCSKVYDSLGNSMEYIYKAEDCKPASGLVPVSGSNERIASSKKYLKRIRYGNRESNRDLKTWQPTASLNEYLFEVVFDYGEHDIQQPKTTDSNPWQMRNDAFSRYNSGFEIRTSRLCTRILMFHHMKGKLVRSENLVSSVLLEYENLDHASKLVSITMRGHTAIGEKDYSTSAMPTTTFQYQKPTKTEDMKIVTMDMSNIEQAPNAEFSDDTMWIDFNGEGMPGLLSCPRTGEWSYQRNENALNFAANGSLFSTPTAIKCRPNFSNGEGWVLQDINEDGKPDLYCVQIPGFFERVANDVWQHFTEFPSWPVEEVVDETMIQIDVTGDGFLDLMKIDPQNNEIVWHPSLKRDGFGDSRRVKTSNPGLIPPCKNSAYHILTADMSGDGLADLVYVSNNKISYWPNLGYGRFGDEVIMRNSPILDAREAFSSNRIRVGDIDGSGTSDMIYLPSDGNAKIYYNLSGSAWSNARTVTGFPRLSSLRSVAVFDLLGKGTACLTWLGDDQISGKPTLRYVDLMAGGKPHLMSSHSNGMGLQVDVKYRPSTWYYLNDDRQKKSWPSALPFPTHCVDTLVVKDDVALTESKMNYAYHDGYYDVAESEFRGFGMVEVWNSQTFFSGSSKAFTTVPTYTKTWFHTGSAQRSIAIQTLNQIGSRLPSTQSQSQSYEVHRALKGCQLREEVYGQGSSPSENKLFTTIEHAYEVQVLRQATEGTVFVLAMNVCETVSTAIDAKPNDARIDHTIVFERDAFGHSLKEASISYGRRQANPSLPQRVQAAQQFTHVQYQENFYTNPISDVENYQAPAPCSQRVFKLSKVPPIDVGTARKVLEVLLVQKSVDARDGSKIDRQPAKSTDQVLISQSRSFYISSDFKSILALGKLETYSTIDTSYELVFDDKILDQIVPKDDSEASGKLKKSILPEAGYVDLDNDGRWWRTTVRQRFSSSGRAEQELQAARKSYYQPCFLYDALNNKSIVELDDYKLFSVTQTDPSGSTTSTTYDYQRLMPVQNVDINRNRVQTSYDALGRVSRIARMGKEDEALGDSLDGYVDMDANVVLSALKSKDAEATALKVLGNAGHATVHNHNRSRDNPAFVIEITRDKHFRDGESQISIEISYLDGHGSPIETFSLVSTNGPVTQWSWLCSGISINASQAVSHQNGFYWNSCNFWEPSRLTSPQEYQIMDACGRAVCTLLPDHSWTKTIYTPWETHNYSAGDTVLIENPAKDPDVSGHFSRLPADSYLPTWSARTLQQDASSQSVQKSRVYNDTPIIRCMDAVGRTTATCTRTPGKMFCTAHTYDLAGNLRFQHDAQDRLAEVGEYDYLGRCILLKSMDSGDESSLSDANDQVLYTWKNRVLWFKSTYDSLGRDVEEWKRSPPSADLLVAKKTYGKAELNDIKKNLCGQLIAAYDQAGLHRSSEFDFKGNCTTSSTQCISDFKNDIDWSQDASLLPQVYEARTRYDAFDRPVSIVDPIGNTSTRKYDRLGRMPMTLWQPKSAAQPTSYISETKYNALGDKLAVKYGNGNMAGWTYDNISNRVVRSRLVNDKGAVLEELNFTYDVEGRIVKQVNKAQQTIYFRNNVIEPKSDFTYDAIGQLVRATGREAIDPATGTTLSARSQMQGGSKEESALISDGKAMFPYTEDYKYDDCGNLLSIKHDIGGDGTVRGWTKGFFYEEPNRLQKTMNSNRLSRAEIGGIEDSYFYDGDGVERGCMTRMPGYSNMTWDFNNLLKSTSRQEMSIGTPERTYYVYDASGKRVRKVTERAAAEDASLRMLKETIYLDGIEIQRRYKGDGKTLEYEKHNATVAGTSTIALVEHELGKDPSTSLVRYQSENSIETDDKGQLISYEEYSPFGTSTYIACQSDIEAPRAYRFASYERDKESGFFYCGLRYYAPWLSKWLSADPGGTIDGLNLFRYCRNDPVNLEDSGGMDPKGRRNSDIIPGSHEFYMKKILPRWNRFNRAERAAEENWQRQAAGAPSGRIGRYHYSEGGEMWANFKYRVFTKPALAVRKLKIERAAKKFEKDEKALKAAQAQGLDRPVKKKGLLSKLGSAIGGLFTKKKKAAKEEVAEPPKVVHKGPDLDDLGDGGFSHNGAFLPRPGLAKGTIGKVENRSAAFLKNQKQKAIDALRPRDNESRPGQGPGAPMLEDYSAADEGKVHSPTQTSGAFAARPNFENWMPRRHSADIEFTSEQIGSTWWGRPILPPRKL